MIRLDVSGAVRHIYGSLRVKWLREDVNMVCFTLKKRLKTHSGKMFYGPPETILKIWPTDILLQCVYMLHVQELCK